MGEFCTCVDRIGGCCGGMNRGDAALCLRIGGCNGGGGRKAGAGGAHNKVKFSNPDSLSLPASVSGVSKAVSAAVDATTHANESSSSHFAGLKASKPGGGRIPNFDALIAFEQVSTVTGC